MCKTSNKKGKNMHDQIVFSLERQIDTIRKKSNGKSKSKKHNNNDEKALLVEATQLEKNL